MTTAASLRFMVASSFLGFRERLWLLIALSADEIQLHIAVDICPDDAVHIAMDLTANQAVHPDMSGAADPGQAGFRHGEGGLVHDLAADEQNLRQYEHNQNHGDDGAPAKALTDAHNGGMGGHHANQDARAGQDGAGSQNRGEGDVHCLDDGLFVRHLGFQLLITAGNHDGVVDIRAHLNGADHQVAQEEQGRFRHSKLLHFCEFTMNFAYYNNADGTRTIDFLSYKHGAKLSIFLFASPCVTQFNYVTR